MIAPSGPARAERLATLLGVGGLAVCAVLWLLPEPPPTKGTGPSASPAAMAALVAGGLLVVGTVRSVVAGWRTRSWPTAHGVVVEARSLGGPYLYTLCRYKAAGAERTLDAVGYGRPGWPGPREGGEVRVHYDPDDPDRGVVQPTPSPVAVSVLAVGIVVLGMGTASLVAL